MLERRQIQEDFCHGLHEIYRDLQKFTLFAESNDECPYTQHF